MNDDEEDELTEITNRINTPLKESRQVLSLDSAMKNK